MKSSTLLQIVFIVAAALAVFGFVTAAKNDQVRASCTAMCGLGPAYAGRDRLAPDFELPDLDGKPVKLSSFRGKVVFLNFWTETCGPCKEEMPSLATLARVLHGRKDMVLLTVTIDEDRTKVRDLLRVLLDGDAPFPVLFDADSNVVGGKYGTKLFPETWVIDKNGIIRARFDGARDWSAASAIEIGEMLKKPSGAVLDFGCPVDFIQGVPRGKHASLCMDDS
ncbi:TlpA disulfide reductase family protein [Polyangium sp. 6x1]|uniref:TlpA family protein disulfide reductase n=1 Tax=Polyangium sp. 6x1 TaxID=3042689 RepID=UPI002482EECF|nr:TlpA disulfide reductase family protein [Polyangium sp. 6x1]MDI1443119.1 TlpA disulfide reductase family protein [Polyangium sp. 6x1]